VLRADLDRLKRDLERPADKNRGLVLIGRRELRSNNSWMHNIPRLTSGAPRCRLKIHPEDAKDRGLRAEELVEVESRVGKIEVRIEIDDAIMPGVVSLPHGYGHQRDGVRLGVAQALEGASANDLTDESVVDQVSGNAVLSGVPVDIRRVEASV
jgi:anaerobic selenocysteine-containing dehydrogenase